MMNLTILSSQPISPSAKLSSLMVPDTGRAVHRSHKSKKGKHRATQPLHGKLLLLVRDIEMAKVGGPAFLYIYIYK